MPQVHAGPCGRRGKIQGDDAVERFEPQSGEEFLHRPRRENGRRTVGGSFYTQLGEVVRGAEAKQNIRGWAARTNAAPEPKVGFGVEIERGTFTAEERQEPSAGGVVEPMRAPIHGPPRSASPTEWASHLENALNGRVTLRQRLRQRRSATGKQG